MLFRSILAKNGAVSIKSDSGDVHVESGSGAIHHKGSTGVYADASEIHWNSGKSQSGGTPEDAAGDAGTARQATQTTATKDDDTSQLA